MSGFETIAMVVSAISTVASAVGQIQQGKAADQAARYQADQMRVNADQSRKSAQKLADERRRQASILASRAQAVGASQGGFDPSTTDIIGDIEAEGEYGALNALYEGEERARLNIGQAGLTEYEGKQAKRSSYYKAAGTTGSFFNKYGADVFGDDPGAAIFGTQDPAPVEYR